MYSLLRRVLCCPARVHILRKAVCCVSGVCLQCFETVKFSGVVLCYSERRFGRQGASPVQWLLLPVSHLLGNSGAGLHPSYCISYGRRWVGGGRRGSCSSSSTPGLRWEWGWCVGVCFLPWSIWGWMLRAVFYPRWGCQSWGDSWRTLLAAMFVDVFLPLLVGLHLVRDGV